jgi:phosphoglycolate phosphatase
MLAHTLVLFDIDATLVKTGGAGIAAMVKAGREMVGEGFSAEGIAFAGRLDALIVPEMFARAGHRPDEGMLRAFRTRYHALLVEHLREHRAQALALPGVGALLEALRQQEHAVTLGLVTGNYAETGQEKLRACGIAPEWFAVAAWGDESPSMPPTRDDLPRVAMDRHHAAGRPAVPAARTVVIGDTPHDVRCGRVNGCRTLGVATGWNSVAELAESGADWAVEDLGDTGAIMRWLLG